MMTTGLFCLGVAAGCVAWGAGDGRAEDPAPVAGVTAAMAAEESAEPGRGAADQAVAFEVDLAGELTIHLADPADVRQAAERDLAKAQLPRARKLEEDLIQRLISIRRPRQIRLTLADCIARAMANSYAIRFESYGPGIELARLIEAEAEFDASIFTNYTSNQAERPSSAAQLTGTSTSTRAFSGGFRKPLATGGRLQVSYGMTRTESNLVFQTLNPAWSNSYVLDFRQPLLRGFGLDTNRVGIELRQVDRQISAVQFRQQVRETLSQVERAYWDLLLARRSVAIDARLLRHFDRLLTTLRARASFDALPIQITQTQSRLLIQQQAFVGTVSRVMDAEDRLKSLLNDPELTLISANLEIIPTDPLAIEAGVVRHSIYPVLAERRDRLARIELEKEAQQKAFEELMTTRPEPPDRAEREEAIRQREAETQKRRQSIEDDYRNALLAIQLAEVQTGLDHREELRTARLRVSSARILQGLARNQALPRFDLTFRYTINGLGANADRAYTQLNTVDFEEWFVGVEFEWPLGNRGPRAGVRRAGLRRSQAEAGVRRAIDEIATDISLALRQMETNFNKLRPSLESLKASQENIETIEARRENLSPTQVDLELNSYERLAGTRRSLLQTLVNFNLSLSDLERSKGTLLEFNNVTLMD